MTYLWAAKVILFFENAYTSVIILNVKNAYNYQIVTFSTILLAFCFLFDANTYHIITICRKSSSLVVGGVGDTGFDEGFTTFDTDAAVERDSVTEGRFFCDIGYVTKEPSLCNAYQSLFVHNDLRQLHVVSNIHCTVIV